MNDEYLARIAPLRDRIDAIDRELLRLLNDRSAVALMIGEIKKEYDIPVYDPEREKSILARLTAGNPGPLDNAAIIRLYERIMDEARRLERQRKQGGEDARHP